MSDFMQSRTLADLKEMQTKLEADARANKMAMDSVQVELARRYEADHLKGLDVAGKMGGTVTSVLVGGLRLKADTAAKVKWDQPKLWALASDFTRDQLEHYCKIELTPKEAVYKALEPGSNIKGAFAAARTDERGNTKFRLLAEGEK